MALCAAACLLAAQPALGADPRPWLTPLPTISPPPRPAGAPMQWARLPPAPRPPAAFAGGRASVGLVRGVDGRALARSLGLELVTSLPALRAVELAGPPSVLARLAARPDPRIRYVEPVRPARHAHVRNDPFTWVRDPGTGVPHQWAFRRVGLDRALNLTKGDRRILVGVVDSGIAAVPDLRGKLAALLWDPDVNKSGADTIGHGTFVSSIIASRNDDGFGLAGYCGACRIAMFKAMPLNDVQIALGVQRLTDAGVRVINISIVSQGSSQNVVDALAYAASRGVLVVAASGNEGLGTVGFPASLVQPPDGAPSSGLAVGGVDARGERAPFSNWGSQLSLVAPGAYDTRCTTGILGALPRIATEFDSGLGCDMPLEDIAGNRYAYASGTSFAAPEVAGIAALVWSVRPDLTATQIAAVLTETARRPAGEGWNPSLGWGVVDARAAVERLAGRPSADAFALSGLRVRGARVAGSALDATVRVRWNDGTPVMLGAVPRCRIAVRGRTISSTPRLRGGVLACAFTLPRGSAGGRVTGRLWLTAPATPPAGARFELIPRAPPDRRL
jgi:subtilisin family serine protease